MNDPEFSAAALSIILAYTKETFPAAKEYLSELDGAAGIRAAVIDTGENDVRYIARSAKDNRALFIGIIAYEPPDGDILSALLATVPVYLLSPEGSISRLLPSGAERVPDGTSLTDIARAEAEARVDAMISEPTAAGNVPKRIIGSEIPPWEFTSDEKRKNVLALVLIAAGAAVLIAILVRLGTVFGWKPYAPLAVFFCAVKMISDRITGMLKGKSKL